MVVMLDQRRGAARLDRVVRQGRAQAQPPRRPQPADPEAQHPLHVQGRGAGAARGAATTAADERRRRDAERRPCPRVAARVPTPRPHPGRPGRHRARDPAQAALGWPRRRATWRPLLVAERAALEAAPRRLVAERSPGTACADLATSLAATGARRSTAAPAPSRCSTRSARAARVEPGRSGAGRRRRRDGGARRRQSSWSRGGVADALVTAPVSKALDRPPRPPGFRGHTDYLAAALRARALRPRLPDDVPRRPISRWRCFDRAPAAARGDRRRLDRARCVEALRCLAPPRRRPRSRSPA